MPSDAGVAELLAREEIRGVLMRLARGTDRRDAALIRSCYHGDAIDDHGAFQGGPADFAAWVADALSIFASTMHVLGNIAIELAGDVAYVESYCTAHHVYPDHDPDGTRDNILGLRYVDRFERRDGRWRIAKRNCVYDYSLCIRGGDAWPLDAPFTRGRADEKDPSYRR